MKWFCASIAPLMGLGCGPSVPAADVHTEGTAPFASESPPSDGDSASPAVPIASMMPSQPVAHDGAHRADLPPSSLRDIQRLFEAPILFIAPGREGRLAVITDEAGQAAPWIFERDAWKRVPLHGAHAAPAANLMAGIYFGRDDRPRLMGYVSGDDGIRMVYLRFKDGQWRPEPKEIGRLGKAPARELYGVLGWDDPEVVCKTEDVCLIKSREGWQELEPVIPASARVRAFGGKAYAATSDGLYRADKAGFVRMGPPAPWITPPAGFWVDALGEITVTEPAANRLHVLDAKADAWEWMESPIAGPQDVAGTASGPIVVGAGGMARLEDGQWHRIGDPNWSLRFALVDDAPESAAIVAGPTGVFRVGATR